MKIKKIHQCEGRVWNGEIFTRCSNPGTFKRDGSWYCCKYCDPHTFRKACGTWAKFLKIVGIKKKSKAHHCEAPTLGVGGWGYQCYADATVEYKEKWYCEKHAAKEKKCP